MIGKLLGLFSQDIAIDLGTANTVVHVRGKGIVLNEPSVVATTMSGSRKVVAVGKDAKEMLGKTPGNIEAIRPMREGVIADFAVTEAMLKYFIQKANQRKYGIASRLVISIPAGITDVETKAVREAAMSAGVREVFLIEQPMAAAVGAGLPVLDARGSMIIDIGGGTSDVAVISLGGMVTFKTLKVAGDKMDEAIINYVRRRFNILIGERTAEAIKIAIGNTHAAVPPKDMEIKGRDLISGVPKSVTITGVDLREALADTTMAIVEAAKSVLERTPPELSADLAERGIVLAGGGANLAGLDLVLREETGIPVFCAENPLLSVVTGVGIVLDDLERYRGLLF
ncbi:MAG: rod shape-determining protein [Myxococcota bacterium]